VSSVLRRGDDGVDVRAVAPRGVALGRFGDGVERGRARAGDT